MNTTVDLSGLNKMINGLLGALKGNGASDGDLKRALKVEAGQCAWKISEALGPATKTSGAEKVQKDMHQYLTINPTYSNLSERQQYSSVNEFTWLSAGPNHLIGINDEDNQVKASASDALKMYYAGRNAGSRGKTSESLGSRGKQRIIRINRTRLSSATFNAVRRSISSKLGQSRAAWARVAAEYLLSKTIPSWIRNQIPAVIGNGKSVLHPEGLNHQEFSIEFGSRAIGVESNPAIREKIAAGAALSRQTLLAKVKKIVAGQIYNWNTGQIYRPTQFEDN